MRLQSKEIQTIIQIAKDIYGETVQVYLFGSRLNDEKRGGDIDLLVRSTGEKKGVLARIRMTARLKLHLGRLFFPETFFYNINFVTKLSRGSKRI